MSIVYDPSLLLYLQYLQKIITQNPQNPQISQISPIQDVPSRASIIFLLLGFFIIFLLIVDKI